MGTFVASGLALIGVPLSAGFISKWYLIKGAIEEGWWPLSILVGLSSLLTVIYIWRVVEVAYFEEPSEGKNVIDEAPVSMLIPVILFVFGSYYFGINATFTADIAFDASRALLVGSN